MYWDFGVLCLLGSHGQLGHGSLVSEDEPRALEALLGVPMKYVAAGGWHSACISGEIFISFLAI